MTTQRMTHGVQFTACPVCEGTIGVRGLAQHLKAHTAAGHVVPARPQAPATPAPSRPVVNAEVVSLANPNLTGRITAIDADGYIEIALGNGLTDRVGRMGFRMSFRMVTA